MCELQDKINDEKQFNFDDILAHAGGFFTDGIETSSIVLNFALYELARDPKMQAKLRADMKATLANNKGELTYKVIQEMTFFECFFKENLRRNSPLFFMTKRVTIPYNIGPMRQDGTGPQITLEVGTPVIIPSFALHYDEEFYPEPLKFKPERFASENKDHLVKTTYLPYSDGPRVCLGSKFGVLQTKVALIAIIRNYNVSVNNKTQEPLKIDPKIFINYPYGGIWLEFNKL